MPADTRPEPTTAERVLLYFAVIEAAGAEDRSMDAAAIYRAFPDLTIAEVDAALAELESSGFIGDVDEENRDA